MVDEMKLKNDVHSNAITGEIIGIAASDMHLKCIRDDDGALLKSYRK